MFCTGEGAARGQPLSSTSAHCSELQPSQTTCEWQRDTMPCRQPGCQHCKGLRQELRLTAASTSYNTTLGNTQCGHAPLPARTVRPPGTHTRLHPSDVSPGQRINVVFINNEVKHGTAHVLVLPAMQGTGAAMMRSDETRRDDGTAGQQHRQLGAPGATRLNGLRGNEMLADTQLINSEQVQRCLARPPGRLLSLRSHNSTTATLTSPPRRCLRLTKW
jgi:hypothetical protein